MEIERDRKWINFWPFDDCNDVSNDFINHGDNGVGIVLKQAKHTFHVNGSFFYFFLFSKRKVYFYQLGEFKNWARGCDWSYPADGYSKVFGMDHVGLMSGFYIAKIGEIVGKHKKIDTHGSCCTIFLHGFTCLSFFVNLETFRHQIKH